jgi:ABC-type Fe3+ transport system substrate-binding protein
MRSKIAYSILVLALLASAACAPAAPAPAAPAAAGAGSAQGQRPLDALIARARAEGELDTATITEVGQGVPRLVDAFNKRFGLDLKINVALGDQAGKYSQLFTTLDAGLPPTFDTLAGSEEDNLRLVEEGRAIKIDDWETLLAEINPLVGSGQVKLEDVSPSLFAGYGFVWTTRDKGLLYNPRVMPESELPKTYSDIANPRYRGKYVVAPWTDQWEIGVLVHKDKQQWLQTVDQIGKNAADVINFSPALDRIMLGEFAFQPSNMYYYWQVKDRDPQAPLDLRYLDDFIAFTKVMYVVPKGSRHPAAATLWALWMTTEEAQAIWQPVSFLPNLVFGHSELDRKNREALQKSHGKILSWYENADTLAELKWYATAEGKQYRARLTEALTQRQH